ncbi:outer membrane beta-barrel protein [Oscillatoria sp. FACHB-1406]|uniref:outer membrane beta-barrel protein n=1 Tax=Oscillatoria sp. FACHB-1406 TaxID=2692846 RepID=UPI001685470F|nr:outer membrane beta-barrel protein [Oscillatoria sp. FACHB-1406]MBD2576960.1 outer membrane beta-barrel protein [Oscillatoria sp. FACHB-1406]
MKAILKSAIALSALSATILSAGIASAQPYRVEVDKPGTDASYVGAGIAAGVTNGGQTGDAATFGGNIQGRVAVPNAPVSVRGAVLFSDETSAIIPMVSYDQPIAKNANVYVGAGYSFVEANGKPTPLGNDNAPVIVAGGEAEVLNGVMVYGDAKWGINAYENSPADAVSLQAGVGYRFN